MYLCREKGVDTTARAGNITQQELIRVMLLNVNLFIIYQDE